MRTVPSLVALCLLSHALALVAAPAALARPPWNLDEPGDAGFFERDDGRPAPFTLEAVEHDAVVSGVVAHVRVRQTFVNRDAAALDARYVFPLASRAAVTAMSMRVGTRTIVAEIEERAAAEKIYEAARADGQRAALVQQHRPNVFETRVANIAPRERIVVELDYVELLVPTSGWYELVIPSVVGRRFTGETTSGAIDWADPALAGVGGSASRDVASVAGVTWKARVTLDAGMPIVAVETPRQVARRSKVEDAVVLSFGETPLERGRDLVVRYALAHDTVRAGVIRFEDAKDQYFLALVQPPARAAVDAVVPRELVFVVDVSGSMEGFPIATSKALMRELIAGLRPNETFNILTFANGSAALAPASIPATNENKAAAERFMSGFSGAGGTELLAALRQVYALPRAPGRSRTIAVLTDGYVTIESQAFALVREHLGDTNVFAFGIGTSVNRYLIEGLAAVGMAEPFVVARQGDAQAASDQFRAYVDAPVLSDVRLTTGDVEAYDVEPPLGALPDVLAERPIAIFGKLRGDASRGTITVSGLGAKGPWSQTLALAAAPRSTRHVAIAKLWARARIQRLADYGSDALPIWSDVARAEVTRLGLEHALLTKFTSFVAVEHRIGADGKPLPVVKEPLVQPLALAPDSDADGIPDAEDACPRGACAKVMMMEMSAQIVEKIYFKSGGARLDARAMVMIDEIVKVMMQYPALTLLIEGHTDTLEARSKRGDADERLSLRRAEAVVAALVARGVELERLTTRGLGDTQPLIDNRTSATRARNRRVEFKILQH